MAFTPRKLWQQWKTMSAKQRVLLFGMFLILVAAVALRACVL